MIVLQVQVSHPNYSGVEAGRSRVQLQCGLQSEWQANLGNLDAIKLKKWRENGELGSCGFMPGASPEVKA